MTWQLNGVTINRLNMEATGQEMVIQEGFQAMIAGLNVFIDGVDPVCP
jgi:hypothetical protein